MHLIILCASIIKRSKKSFHVLNKRISFQISDLKKPIHVVRTRTTFCEIWSTMFPFCYVLHRSSFQVTLVQIVQHLNS